MSRIGKKPIAIPSGVEVKIENNLVTLKGPKGTETVAYRENNYLEYNEKFSSLDDFCDSYIGYPFVFRYRNRTSNLGLSARQTQ